MNYGNLFILVGLIATVLSVLAYLLPKAQKAGRLLFVVGALGTIASQAALFYFLMNKRYDVSYVFKVSDNTLPPVFRFSASWAAQEGSFMLWACYTALIGLIALRYLGRFERRFMVVYGLVLAGILGILAYQTPYTATKTLMVQAFAKEKMELPPHLQGDGPFMPVDGRGMNAQLENYWMAIHPPIIFIGFTLLTVLFAYAIAAMWMREWDEWARRARPWAALSVAILGFGIALGGFWAYETLGWGGFWAWDPVENVSFLPWLACAALLHGLYVQTARNKLRWFNLFMAGLPFVLFAYGTFITRSGVLADMSVHAFAADLKSGALLILLWGCRLSLAVLVGMWLWRLRDFKAMPKPEPGGGPTSREGAFTMSVASLLIMTFFVGLGTFLPLLLTQWLGRAPQKAEIPYYLITGGLLVVPMALFMAVGPWLSWKGTDFDTIIRRINLPWLLTAGFACVSLFAWWQPLFIDADRNARLLYAASLLVSVFCFFAFVSNVWRLPKLWKTSKVSTGGLVAHAGIALLILGLVISQVGERKKEITLVRDVPVEAFGKFYQFAGMSSHPERKTNKVLLKVRDEKGRIEQVSMRFYLDMRSMQGPDGAATPVRWPYIQIKPTYDTYVTFADNPAEILDREQTPLHDELKKGQTKKIGPYTLTFQEFHMDGEMGKPGFSVGARMLVTDTKGQRLVAEPRVVMNDRGQLDPEPVQFEDGGVLGVQPNAERKSVMVFLFNVPGMPKTAVKTPGKMDWVLPLEVRQKPMTIFVWAGAALLLVGGLMSSRSRALDARAYLNKGKEPAERTAEDERPSVLSGANVS